MEEDKKGSAGRITPNILGRYSGLH